jgi:gas vesicle protein
MDQKMIVKQMIDFHKSTFTNSFNAMVMLQDQTEKILNTFFSQASWVPEDLKKVVVDWTSTYKKGRDEFKKAVDENFKKVDEFFGAQEKAKGK